MSGNPKPANARDVWEAASHGWAKWEDTTSQAMAAGTAAMIDMAGVRPGMRVLDIACGAGRQSLHIAERVGPEGRVLAQDISPTMLDHVRQNAAQAGLDNIETLECAADQIDASAGPFDAAVCRSSLMLFPSPSNTVKAVLQALKPGARFAALVFTTPANNPFMAQPMQILLRSAGKTPPPPGQPGIFALGADGMLENLMRNEGFADVNARTVPGRLRLPDVSAAITMMQEAFGAYRAVIADLAPEEQERAWDEVRACLRQFETGDAFEGPIELLIVSGARPA